MKKKFGLKQSVILLALLLNVFILSCNKEEINNSIDSNLLLKNGNLSLSPENILNEDVVCELTAGQFINSGNVIYEKVGENLVVTYIASNGWLLKEVHLYVGTLEDFPTNKKAIQTGHFPYFKEKLGGVDTWSFEIPLSELNLDEHCIIAAHAVVYNAELEKEETAWSNCEFKPIITAKVKFDERNAETEGLSYIDNFRNGEFKNAWCDYLGYNFYKPGSGGDEYSLVNGTHFPNDNAGNVVISDNATGILVEINTKYPMEGSYLYVGSLYGFLNIKLRTEIDDCPNYYLFPFRQKNGMYHVYDITIPETQKSIAFNTLFDSNKWGWVSILW